jgi:hypothetical protein
MKPSDSLVLHFASYDRVATYSVPHLQTLTRVDGPQDGGRAEPLALPVLLHDTMWPWSKKEDAPQAASAALSEPPAAAAPKAPAASDDVWVDLLKCSLSEAERDALIHTDSEEPCEFARGTVLKDGKGTERRVRLDGSELELSVHADAVAPANPAVQDDLDDVSQLSQLNEATLLHHIASRYLEQQQIYTRAGPVLVAMNPFTRLPELYSDVQLARYQVEEKGGGVRERGGCGGGYMSYLQSRVVRPTPYVYYQASTAAAAAEEESGAPQVAPPPPHVYEVAGVVYNSLRLRGTSQSVVINGESGAGATETATTPTPTPTPTPHPTSTPTATPTPTPSPSPSPSPSQARPRLQRSSSAS